MRRRTAVPVRAVALGPALLLVRLRNPWRSDLVAGQAQERSVVRMSHRLAQARSTEHTAATGAGEGPLPAAARPPRGEAVGIVCVPRFGDDCTGPVASAVPC